MDENQQAAAAIVATIARKSMRSLSGRYSPPAVSAFIITKKSSGPEGSIVCSTATPIVLADGRCFGMLRAIASTTFDS